MDTTTITCPKCQTSFPLTDAIERTILDRFRSQLNQESQERDELLRRREQALEAQAQKLKSAEATFQQRLDQRLQEETRKIAAQQELKAKETFGLQMRELRDELDLKTRKLTESQEAELKLRKERLAFEEEKKAFDLELARRSDQVRALVAKEKDDEFRLREAESNKKLEEMKRQIDDLRRKAEQGSQQTQGEVLELDLEAALQRCFDRDEIVSVPKGTHGGDLLQHVRDEMGRSCGTMIWELKRTKTWSEGWLDKLKEDQRQARAQLAILVSTTLPKDLPHFECRQNVWVSPPMLALPLAAALRVSLIETGAAKRAIEGRQDKMSIVYDYLAGPEFKARVTAIVEAFSVMRQDLEKEKRAMQKLWAVREKQIDRVLTNTVGMHGDLQGIIGQTLPAIDLLELTSLPDPVSDADGQ